MGKVSGVRYISLEIEMVRLVTRLWDISRDVGDLF